MGNSPVVAPSAVPSPGNYTVTKYITLSCATPGARIHYTTDGTPPTSASARFDPFHPIPVQANDGERGLKREIILRAVAVKEGFPSSPEVVFSYAVQRRDQDVYVHRSIHPGAWMIEDFEGDKMFLLAGSQRALLIDAGMGRGNLRQVVESLSGGLPLDVVVTHGHPDHIACLGQFQDDCRVWMHPADLPLLQLFISRMHFEIDPDRITPLAEGMVFDLGEQKLRVYELPGHSPGSIVLLDEENGILFAGDALGSNRAHNGDTLWLQMPGMPPVDEYLSSLQVFRSKVGDQVKAIYTGHNDQAVGGAAYMDHLQRAAQNLVDRGEAILVPSMRPTDAWLAYSGDRLSDPNWAAINLRKESCLSAPPEQIATLSNLQVSPGGLDRRFQPGQAEYRARFDPGMDRITITPTPTSSRCASLTINGQDTPSGVPFTALLSGVGTRFEIVVTAPDGETRRTYTLQVTSSS